MNNDVHGEAKQVEMEDEEGVDGLLAFEELVPFTQTLITPTLACFFNLTTPKQEQEQEGERKEDQEEAFREVDAQYICSHQLDLSQSDPKIKLCIDQPYRASPHAPEGRSNGNFLDASEFDIAAAPVDSIEPDDCGEREGCKHGFVLGLEARAASCKRQMNGFDYSLADEVDDREGYGMNEAERENSSSNSGDGATGSGSGGGSARMTLKRPRLVWTPQLHKRFVDAVAHLGIKNAVPKNIMQLMNVEGMTRENVASHLQKYRLYLRRVQQRGNLFSNTTFNTILNSPKPLSPSSDHLFSDSASSIRAQAHHHHHNHSIPAQQHTSLIFPQPHHLQAAAMVTTPPFNNTHFNPHPYNAVVVKSSPLQRSISASPHVNMDHPHQPCHVDTPPAPPRRALTLFPRYDPRLILCHRARWSLLKRYSLVSTTD